MLAINNRSLQTAMKVLFIFLLAFALGAANILKLKDVPVHPRDLPIVHAPEGRITNGNPATDGMFPHQVGLIFNGWFCGGSIIGDEWIVTASHCTSSATFVKIYMGSATLSTPALIRYSEEIYTNPLYNPITLANDIALIKMDPIQITNNINKVLLPSLTTLDKYVGESVIASGFGRTSDTSTTVSQTLNYVTMNVISNKECAEVYGPLLVNPMVICTATPNGMSTCLGDSGGPLITTDLHPLLIGVTSFGHSSGCESGKPAAFERVTSHLLWIKLITNIFY